MRYYSTRHKVQVSLKEAVLQGLAPDGGLYMPEDIPHLSEAFFNGIESKTLPEIGFEIISQFTDESIPESTLREIAEEVLNFNIPVVKVKENIYSLELFHGPTMAFKDIGARFMARLMSHFSQHTPLNVIVATSGDTGSAVAAGFFDVPGINVYILYPKGKVSPMQEKQLTTWGKNITALEINGSFDDCQTLAKQLLSDEELKKRITLTSANSINIGRLIPQSIYYFWAYARLKHLDKDIVFAIPSGNFGNLTAGIIAKKMGLPVKKFIAATNANDVIPEYLQTGVYQPRPSKTTISNAMDVGSPSNYERMKDLFNHHVHEFRECLNAYSFTDFETSEALKSVYETQHYLLDPHGAVAWLGLTKYLKEENTETVGVILETAHPAKFLEVVEDILKEKIELPEKLSAFNGKEKRSIVCNNNYEEIRQIIEA